MRASFAGVADRIVAAAGRRRADGTRIDGTRIEGARMNGNGVDRDMMHGGVHTKDQNQFCKSVYGITGALKTTCAEQMRATKAASLNCIMKNECQDGL